MTELPARAPTPSRSDDVHAIVTQGKRNSSWLRWGLGAFLLLGIGGGLYWWQVRASEPPLIRYKTSPVSVGDLKETVTAIGTLSPVNSVELGAEVTGRLVKVSVDVNDEVQAGQVLAEIDPEQLQARAQEASASLNNAIASQHSAEASLSEAELKAERTKALFERGLTSSSELETAQATAARAKASVAAAKAQVTVARAGIKSAQTALNRARIIAPISGVVLARNVEQGQTLTAGFQTPVLFTLGRPLTDLELKVEVDEADIGKVQEGQSATFTVDAYPNKQFEAQLFKLHNLPTETTGTSGVVTYSAVLAVANPDRLLRPGMTATATITTRTLKDATLVPNVALRFEPPRTGGSAPRGNFLPIPGMRSPRPQGPPNTAAKPAAPKGAERIWVQVNGVPKPMFVEVVGTDGNQSAIKPVNESEAFGDDLKVITDVMVDSGS